MAFCQTEKLGALAEHERVSINEKRAGPPFGKVRKGRIDLAFRRSVQRLNLRSESASRPLAALPERFFLWSNRRRRTGATRSGKGQSEKWCAAQMTSALDPNTDIKWGSA